MWSSVCIFLLYVVCRVISQSYRNYECEKYGNSLPGGNEYPMDYQNFEPSGLTYYPFPPYNDSLLSVGDNGQIAFIDLQTDDLIHYVNLTFPEYLMNYTALNMGLIPPYDVDFEGVTVGDEENIIYVAVEHPPKIMKVDIRGNGTILAKYEVQPGTFPRPATKPHKQGLEGLCWVPYLYDHGVYQMSHFFLGNQYDGNIYIYVLPDIPTDPYLVFIESFDTTDILAAKGYSHLTSYEISGIYYYKKKLYVLIDLADTMLVINVNEMDGRLGDLDSVVTFPVRPSDGDPYSEEGIMVLEAEIEGFQYVYIAEDRDGEHSIFKFLYDSNGGKFMADSIGIGAGIIIFVIFITIGIIGVIVVLNVIAYKKRGSKKITRLEDLNTIDHSKQDTVEITTHTLKKLMTGNSINDIIPLTESQQDMSEEVQKVIQELSKEDIMIDKSKITTIKAIGSGSFGSVYLGEYQVGGASLQVAIKQIVLTENTNVDDIKREVKIMTTIKNKYVLQCFGVYFDKSVANLVMEFCDTGDLFGYKKKMKPNLKLLFLLQIARGMDYLHSRDVVHRDLKTQNILIKNRDTVKICDFGTSKIGAEQNTTTLCGTPEYIAPEILDGDYDPKLADIYSFAIIIWEIFSMNVPFVEELAEFRGNQFTMLDKLKEMLQTGVRPPVDEIKDKCPQDVIDLMVKNWSNDPFDRHQSFFEIVDELTAIIKVENKKRKEKRKKAKTANIAIGAEVVGGSMIQTVDALRSIGGGKIDEDPNIVISLPPQKNEEQQNGTEEKPVTYQFAGNDGGQENEENEQLKHAEKDGSTSGGSTTFYDSGMY